LKKRLFIGFVLAVALVAILSIFLFHKGGSPGESVTGEPVVEVKVAKPTPASDNLAFDTQGKVTAKKSHVVTALSEGKVSKVFVSPSESVSKGQIIALLENKELDCEFSTQKEKLELSRKNAEDMEKKEKGSEEMFTLGVISESDLVSVKQELNLRKSEESDQQNAYDRLEERVKNYRIVADTDGYVSDIVPEESFVTYGQKAAEIISLEDEQVEAFTPFDTTNQPHPGDEALITCNNIIIHGKVSHCFPSANSNLVKVIVIPSEPIPMNLDVKVTFKVSKVKGLMIPKSAVVMDEGKPVIYLVRDNKAVMKDIKVEKDYLDRVLIVNELNSDDVVVIENAYLLSDQMNVTVK
jgi:RND family efflux transporter MFP subunit